VPPSSGTPEFLQGATNTMPESAAGTDQPSITLSSVGAGITAPVERQDLANEDLRITATLRRAIVGDTTLSFAAHNVQIVTQGGTVMLSGPVKSGHERGSIERKARSVLGVTAVDNQLEVRERE